MTKPKSFVEEFPDDNGQHYTALTFLLDRDERFREGNDKTWGEGNWIRCNACLDSLGYPAYHHKEAHAD